MSTFDHRYGPTAMLEGVAAAIKDIEQPDTGSVDVHTITLVLNGYSGEFDVTIEATDDSEGFLESRKWTGIAGRYGQCDVEEVEL
jgi:hypothetical protein